MNGPEGIGKAHTSERKTRHLNVFLSEAEHTKLVTLSKESGLSISAVVRHLIREQEVRPRPNADFLSLYNAVRSLECDLNLLTRRLSREQASQEDLKEALSIMREVSSEIGRWKQQWL